MKSVNESYFQAEYEEALNAITFRWLTSPTSQEYKSALHQLLTMIKANRADAIIFNTVGLGAISEEDQAWTIKEWSPMAVAAGHKRSALIMPTDIFAQMAVNDMMEQLQEDETTPANINQYFDNEEDARTWIDRSAKATTA